MSAEDLDIVGLPFGQVHVSPVGHRHGLQRAHVAGRTVPQPCVAALAFRGPAHLLVGQPVRGVREIMLLQRAYERLRGRHRICRPHVRQPVDALERVRVMGIGEHIGQGGGGAARVDAYRCPVVVLEGQQSRGRFAGARQVVNDLHERRQSPANADAGGYHRVGRVQGHAHAEAHAHPMLRRDRLVHGVGPQQGVDGPVCAAGVADVAERPRPTLRVVVELTAEPGQLVEIEQITGPRVISPYGFEILRVGIERYAEIKERGTVGDIAGPQPVQAVVEILAAGVALRARPPYLRSHAGELQARGGRGDETVLEVLRLLF